MGEFGIIIQVLISGILFGTMYGVAAIGLSLIFGTMRIIFFAQGTMIIFFAYICYWLFTLIGIDPYLSLILLIPISLLLGMGFYYGLFKEAAALEQKEVSLLIAIGLMWAVENIMTRVWTADPRAIVTAYTSWILRPFGINIPFTRLIALLIAVLSAIGVSLFLKRTRIGTAVRAASEDMESTTLMGINPHWVNAVTFAIGIGLAGIAGVGLATVYSFDPMYGFTFVIMSVIALALGGMGNVFGALLGGIILGLIYNLTAYFIDSTWANAICFVVFLLVLMFRPQGLFGGAAQKV
ncbi:MAG: branched-chain amino acid ABC transporter permease [Dehalococcoidia bacterium]|nr:branched-chain amino acid ABC transporter permease [Dehalococcoidia bacterium]MDH5781286.1 branched-chain amino acid ABC transporter permease [Dehalococcoidia bacterium]